MMKSELDVLRRGYWERRCPGHDGVLLLLGHAQEDADVLGEGADVVGEPEADELCGQPQQDGQHLSPLLKLVHLLLFVGDSGPLHYGIRGVCLT